MSEKRERGKVRWFSAEKGWGFLTTESGEDVFVHYKAIRGDGYRSLKEGAAVEFDVVESPKGLEAADVVQIPLSGEAEPKGRSTN